MKVNVSGFRFLVGLVLVVSPLVSLAQVLTFEDLENEQGVQKGSPRAGQGFSLDGQGGAASGRLPSISNSPRPSVQGTSDSTRYQKPDELDSRGNRFDKWSPLSGFQRFVLESTGRLLPIFGASALERVSQNLKNQPVSEDYVVMPGDELLVRAWGGVEINYQATVDRDGQLTIPTVGTFPVAGVRARDVDAVISTQLRKYYKGFSLSTTFGKLSGFNVFVSGHASEPGLRQVNSSTTLSSVAFSVAKPNESGSYRNIELRRGGKTVASFDLYSLLATGHLTADYRLQPGDVIYIGQVGTRVALNVDSPSAAIFELKSNETLDDLLSLAGVDRTLIRQDQVLIEGIRVDTPAVPRTVERVDYSFALKQTKLKDGDVITFFSANPSFGNAVTLKGNVADAARYPFADGMKVSTLIPSVDVLIPKEYFKKKNALVGLNHEREEGGQQEHRLASSRSWSDVSQRGGSPLMKGAQSPTFQGLDKLTNQGGRTSDPRFDQESDVLMQKPESKIEMVEQTIRSMLNQINWDYAVVERLDRQELRTILIPFNLKKAMLKDPKHDIELQAGDVVTVFGVNDGQIPKERKTALIKVTGEVSSPGFYQISSGETLRDVLVKAGGLTSNAYLYGTYLTRESIRAQQEKKFQRALDQAEQLMFSSQSSRMASAVTPADASSVLVQQENQKQYLSKLRSVKPDGRVVLDMKPKATVVAELPPLSLEDGDVIAIPSLPGEVSIFGSVYSQGVYAYQKGNSVLDYLAMAGGATKTSDKQSIFVLRANGMVESAQQSWIPFMNGLNGVAAQPGDTIYVPEDFDRVSLIKTLADISQVFYQVGLGAAAIKVLKD